MELEAAKQMRALTGGDLAEHDVLAVQPRGDGGGEEELFRQEKVRVECNIVRKLAEAHTMPFTPAAQTVYRMPTWEPLVLGPELAMESRPSVECFSWKFSSFQDKK